MDHEPAGGLAHLIEQSALGQLVRESLWIYPAASVLHVLGLALLLGTILAFDLRVLGAARAIPLPAARAWLPRLAASGFVVQLVTGSMMLVSDASHLLANPAFQAKLALIVLALGNVWLLHKVLSPDPSVPVASWAARASALLSLLLWTAVATLGRFTAYL